MATLTNQTLTALGGVRVGHSTHPDKLTGCTAVVFDQPYPVGYKAYGGAPGSFNTDGLAGGMSFYRRNGLFVAGGSATGLASAAGIMNGMIDDRVRPVGAIHNPLVSGAIVFDLGTRVAQYDPAYGREAYDNATAAAVVSGNVGGGTGTTVGKFHNLENGSKLAAMKAGVGSARVDVGGGVIVCALSVVNAVGNVVKPNGEILAGNRDERRRFKVFEDLTSFVTRDLDETNTTISIVGTNLDLQTRENYERLAHFGSQGQVRAIDPVHTSIDGDIVFAFSTEEQTSMFNEREAYFRDERWPLLTVDILGHAAAKAVQHSIYDACESAENITFDGAYQGIVPAARDYR